MQVTDELEADSIGHEFVGVERNFNEQQAIIYHTRQLQEDDIVHELLHIRYPNWSEDKVEYWTSLLLGERVIQLENDMQLLLPTG
jgi:hypothetical protein